MELNWKAICILNIGTTVPHVFDRCLFPDSLGSRLNLQTIGATAVLYPDIYSEGPKIAKAENAIDGLSHVGSTGAVGATYCACTGATWSTKDLQYLRVDLKSSYFVKEIKLFLRDEQKRQRWMNGLKVFASNVSMLSKAVQCGDDYNDVEGGQHPAFSFNDFARYLWMVLRKTSNRVQVCEVEVYGGKFI